MLRTAEPLPSWNDGPVKAAILDFVARVTNATGREYVPPQERIAAFDNDGTLWTEHPMPAQLYFTLHRIAGLAVKAPGISERRPFTAFLERDLTAIRSLGKQAAFEIGLAIHAGLTDEEYALIARGWLATARHPTTGLLFKQCTYTPQVELLAHLRENGFKTYVVSAGGADFIRVFAEGAYGVPPHQVIGSSVKLRLDRQNGRAVLLKSSDIETFNDHEAKAVNLGLRLGVRPILAVGNSDGDLAMLRYVTSGQGARLALLIHHDDAEREAAYDREFRLSPLSEGLDRAREYDIAVVSMKRDWKVVFGDDGRSVVTPFRKNAVSGRATVVNLNAAH
jgi:phosphoserine phosphatase